MTIPSLNGKFHNSKKPSLALGFTENAKTSKL